MPYRKTIIKLIKLAAPVLLGLVVIAALALKAGVSHLIDMILGIDPVLVIASAGLLAIATLLKAFRWYLLIKEKGMAIYSYFMCQTTNVLLPAGCGELLKIALLKGKNGTTFINFLPGITLEAAMDIALLLILSSLLATVFLDELTTVVLLLLLIACAVMVLKPSLLYGISRQACKLKKFRLLSPAIEFTTVRLDEFIRSMEFYSGNKKLMAQCMLLTILAWVVMEPLSQYVLFLDFHINVSYASLLAAVAISMILGIMSLLPGGIGARDLVFAMVMAGSGTPFEICLSIAMIYRMIAYVLFPALTVLIYLAYKKKLIKEKMQTGTVA